MPAKGLKTKPNLPAKRKRDREGSTQALLEAAVEVFSEQGYDAATTREVARRAGISEALIQRYFKGKSGLLLAIMKSFAEDKLGSELAGLPLQDSVEKEILQLLTYTCNEHKAHAAFIRVALSRAIVDPELGQLLRSNVHERRLPTIVARLLHYQQTGKIPKDADLGALAYGVSAVAFSIGFMGPQVFGYEYSRMDEIARTMAKVLARGIS